MDIKVKVNNDEWNKKNGLRVIVYTDHDPLSRSGCMYSVDDARYLANKLLEACDEVESHDRSQNSLAKESFIKLGKALGFMD